MIGIELINDRLPVLFLIVHAIEALHARVQLEPFRIGRWQVKGLGRLLHPYGIIARCFRVRLLVSDVGQGHLPLVAAVQINKGFQSVK